MPVISILFVVMIAFALLVVQRMLAPQRLDSMRRTLVFALLGPTLYVALAVLIDLTAGRVPEEDIFWAFMFSLVVSIVIGPIDGYLAHFFPLQLRAPLSATAGAVTVAFLLFSITKGQFMSAPVWTPIVLSGAVCMGLCSLLSGPFRDEPS